MGIEFPLLSFLLYLLPKVAILLVIIFTLRYSTGEWSKGIFALFILGVVSLVYKGVTTTYTPRITLEQEAGSPPSFEGVTKDSSPEKKTFDERLEENQNLYEKH